MTAFPPETFTAQESLKQDIRNLLSELTPQPKRSDYPALRGWTMAMSYPSPKSANRMNISRERVRQLEQQALKHLRRRKSAMHGYLAS